MSEHRRRERRYFYCRGGIEFVTVDVHFIIETPQRENAEIGEHHEQIDELRHLSKHDHPQCKKNRSADHERDPFEFRKIRVDKRTHADIVIQRVDLLQIVLVWRLPPLKLIGVDIQNQSVGKLIGIQCHLPQRCKERRQQHGCGENNDQPAPHINRYLEKRICFFYIVLHYYSFKRIKKGRISPPLLPYITSQACNPASPDGEPNRSLCSNMHTLPVYRP